MFSGASNLAEGVDRAFVFIFAVSIIFIVGITAFMIYTVIRFNRRKGIPAKQFSGSTILEIIWTGVPLIIVLIMFYVGWVGFAPMRKPPKDAMVVTAIGRMWEWEFDYGNGLRSKDLVLPVGKPVKIDLVSEDVNHSLFIPAFRVKEDVIPGYRNFLWFIPNYIGNYEILCTEYCGMLHSSMLSKAIIISEEEYAEWFKKLSEAGPRSDPKGFIILRETGCLACHSTDGSKLVGPTFKNLFGSTRNIITEGGEKSVTAGEEYIIKSIYDPDSEIVKGYPKAIMKSYSDILKEDDLGEIIEYLKTLSGLE